MFSPESLEFLSINHIENNREWFRAHKTEYAKYVQAPMHELVSQLTPFMLETDAEIICDPKRNGTLSRIYRDTRFSHDKSLYRSTMWIMFSRDKKENPFAAEFFFVFSPSEFFYGCGYYEAPAKITQSIRRLVLQRNEVFEEAQAAYEKQNVFKFGGDMYKRAKYPDADEKLRPWLERKTIYFISETKSPNLLFSPDLCEKLKCDYELLIPQYKFLRFAEASADIPDNSFPSDN